MPAVECGDALFTVILRTDAVKGDHVRMPPVIAVPASAVSREDLNSILTDYLALDRARVFRQRLACRLGGVAAAIALTGSVLDGLSHAAWWVALVLATTPALGAWFVERRLAQQLARRLDGVSSVIQTRPDAEDRSSLPAQKVIKSS
jgi:hypothetical protein